MPDRLTTTRRAALGGIGVAILTTTGCDADDLDPRPAAPGAAGSSGRSSPAAPEDADTALVQDVVAAIGEAVAAVAAARTDPRLDPRLAPLADLHLAHLALLDAEPGTAGTTGSAEPAPGGRGRLLRGVSAAERDLQRRLAGGALAAGSGDLARVLAAMSAAVAQQIAVLRGAS